MTALIHDWLELCVRWFHLIVGISWIGNSFYFMWLDSQIKAPQPPKDKVIGDLWMVHSGGFYQIEKRKIAPGEMPKILHWFIWEATLTWISGVALLVLVYYMRGGLYLLDPSISNLNAFEATTMSLVLIGLSWFIYDFLWQSSLSKKGDILPGLLSFGLLIVLAYLFAHTLSGRAAFLHVAAVMGTLMVVNVWVRILPAQRQMIKATEEGRSPNFELGANAKRRSVHNSYMTLPVVFMMFSNHYAMITSHRHNWILLGLLVLVGGGMRHILICLDKEKPWKWLVAPLTATLLFTIYLTFPKSSKIDTSQASPSFLTVRSILNQRCQTCHSTRPTDDIFRMTAAGISFESTDMIQKLASRIKERAVISKTMPLGNKTGMTDEEREILGKWIDAGAKLED